MTDRQQYALLLSGGGARAAYQVGVLKAITNFLPRNQSIPFPIICGNSAGAINATSLACYASCYHLGVRKLEWVWKNFRTQQVYKAGMSDVFGYLLRNYLAGFRSTSFRPRPASLLNNQPLRELIRKMLDFSRIDRNLARGYLRALSVTASSYSSHDSIAYFQGQADILDWHREQRRGKSCILNIEHLMASSAIPMVFPTVHIEGEYLGDGSVHQLSPLSTPIHLGARKIMVIGVEQPELKFKSKVYNHHPTNAEIAGHLLDTIFSDTLHADLERMQRINSTLELLTERQREQTALRNIECLIINPSINFTEVAARHFHRLPAGSRSLLRMIGVNDESESSILSYLLFEKEYCQELINLGFQDGLARKEEMRQFLRI